MPPAIRHALIIVGLMFFPVGIYHRLRAARSGEKKARSAGGIPRKVAVDWPHCQLPVGFDPARTSQPGEMCKPPSECHFHEVVLKRGDILCLPAGCWHSAEAIGHSLALNLAFSGFVLLGTRANVDPCYKPYPARPCTASQHQRWLVCDRSCRNREVS